MQGLYLEDFEVGRKFEHALRRTVTEMDNTLFSCLTHNPQPLHIDHDFAAKTEWGKPLVNSMFTLGLMIGISVNDTTLGTTIGNLGMTEVKFPKPVFHGDTLHVTTEVLTRRETPLAARCRHRRVPAQGLQSAGRAGRRMPAPGHDAQETQGLSPCARCCSFPATTRRSSARAWAAGADALILDLEDSVSAAAQGRGPPDRGAVHRRDARAREAAAASTCASMRSTRRCGRTILPASSARGPTASCCPRRARARTCTSCRSPCIMPRSVPERRRERRASSPSRPRCRSRCSSSHTYVGASARLEGLTWGAEDLAAACRRADQPRGGRQLDLALPAGAQPVPVHGRRRQRAADRHRVRRFPRRAGLSPGSERRRPRRLHGQDGDPPQPGGRDQRDLHAERPRRSPRAQEIVKAFADNPDAGVLAIGGQMVDRAHVQGAERILARAKIAAPPPPRGGRLERHGLRPPNSERVTNASGGRAHHQGGRPCRRVLAVQDTTEINFSARRSPSQ